MPAVWAAMYLLCCRRVMPRCCSAVISSMCVAGMMRRRSTSPVRWMKRHHSAIQASWHGVMMASCHAVSLECWRYAGRLGGDVSAVLPSCHAAMLRCCHFVNVRCRRDAAPLNEPVRWMQAEHHSAIQASWHGGSGIDGCLTELAIGTVGTSAARVSLGPVRRDNRSGCSSSRCRPPRRDQQRRARSIYAGPSTAPAWQPVAGDECLPGSCQPAQPAGAAAAMAPSRA